MRRIPPLLTLSCLLATCIIFSPAKIGFAKDDKPILSLPPTESSRFEVTDRVWPEDIGQPHVCLWKDDALAAVSITIDDNTAPDHEWWSEQGRKYGVRVTWFVITSLVNDERPGYHGCWDAFRKLYSEGHDIQSHTITHVAPGRGFDPDDPARDLEFEYRQSQEIIKEQIGCPQVSVLAYPGGKYQHEHRDRELAAKYYIAARGGAGLINPVNRVNYRETHSIGNGLHFEDPENHRNCLLHLIEPETAFRPYQYRGWFVTHFHRVQEEDKPRLERSFAFLRDSKADIWTGLFRNVAQYGQERDTATTKVNKVGDSEIRFTVTDRMNDAAFDFPLTIKIRINNSWNSLLAIQNEKPTDVKLVVHDGNKYALVQVVPDRGEIILQAQ